jgi:hypothetical protein
VEHERTFRRLRPAPTRGTSPRLIFSVSSDAPLPAVPARNPNGHWAQAAQPRPNRTWSVRKTRLVMVSRTATSYGDARTAIVDVTTSGLPLPDRAGQPHVPLDRRREPTQADAYRCGRQATDHRRLREHRRPSGADRITHQRATQGDAASRGAVHIDGSFRVDRVGNPPAVTSHRRAELHG